MTTKQLGNIGESKVLCEFVKRGIPVFIPFGDNESADIVAEFNGKLNKIQVKSTSLQKVEGAIEFNVSKRPTGKGERIHYLDGEVDFFALYAIHLDLLFLVPYDTIKGKSTFTIRYNNYAHNSNKGEDYTFDKILK